MRTMIFSSVHDTMSITIYDDHDVDRDLVGAEFFAARNHSLVRNRCFTGCEFVGSVAMHRFTNVVAFSGSEAPNRDGTCRRNLAFSRLYL